MRVGEGIVEMEMKIVGSLKLKLKLSVSARFKEAIVAWAELSLLTRSRWM